MLICLVRESGGLGDIVCAGGAISRLKSEGHNVVFVTFKEYEDALNHVGCDLFYELPSSIRSERRERCDTLRLDKSYMEWVGWIKPDMIYDLFCPGYRHEKEAVNNNEEQSLNRIEAYQISCGFYDNFAKPTWTVSDRETEIAKRWFISHKISPSDSVVLHTRATDVCRTYSEYNIRTLIDSLKQNNVSPIMIDSDSCVDLYKDIATVSWREPIWLKAAVMKLCDRFIGVDSAFMHIAGALDLSKSVTIWGSTNAEVSTRLYKNMSCVKARGYDKVDYKEKPKMSGRVKVAENQFVFTSVNCRPPCVIPPEFCRSNHCVWLDRVDPHDIVKELLK